MKNATVLTSVAVIGTAILMTAGGFSSAVSASNAEETSKTISSDTIHVEGCLRYIPCKVME